ncbi:RecB ATP-dependent exoDNAse (exonuclease V) beta subunit (contains helicase and exonuclease domains) [Methylophilaceae bacterium]
MSETLMALDSAARVQALEKRSFIVQAPAGAGKTELLAQRYLSLLATVDEPEEIIALTFTNKAAAEMRNRILLSLEQAEQAQPETAPHKLKTRQLADQALKRSAQKNWQLIKQPSRLRILTMDALCSSLTRQMPLLSRFGSQPAVSDDANRHYLEAARLTLADIVDERHACDTVSMALTYMDNDAEKLTALLANMLAKRDQWIKKTHELHGQPETDTLASMERVLRHLIVEELTLVSSVLTDEVQQALLPLIRFAASHLPADDPIAPLLDRQACLNPCIEDLPLWRAIAHFLLTKDKVKTYRKNLNKTNGFPSDAEHKPKKEQCLAILAQLSQADLVGNILSLPPLSTLQDSQPVISALSRLLQQANAHLWVVFQKAAEVDFVAIAQQASWALEDEHGATDLALKLDYKISHLLIDEFQDTSPVQMKLIEQLIAGWQPHEERTLFCVGDPMQSIYRFRKADVSLFLEAQNEGINGFKLAPLQLALNYRSRPKVIDWINQAFTQVFPNEDAKNHGAIRYSPFTASLGSVNGEGVSVHPLIWPASNSGEDAKDEDDGNPDLYQLEAVFVAKLIKQLKTQLNPPQKIAVLVRSRNHLQALVTEIRRHHKGLHFQALEIEPLNERQSVQDAWSLLCALIHRADRTHWLNVLRAPWCGLNLADLHALAGNGQHDSIWAAMQDEARLRQLSDDGRMRLQHAREVINAAFECQGRLPLRRWLERTWLQLGGAQCLFEAGDNRDVQVFFDLLEKHDRSGQIDLTSLEAAMKKLYAKPDSHADGSVQFLTIHKAKGLEFDSVILPALNRKSRADDNDLLLWEEVEVEHERHLIAAPVHSTGSKNTGLPNLYDYIKNLEKIRSNNEVVRLLYVATTRSQRQLHLIASMQKNNDGELKPVANSLLAALWPAVAEQFINTPEQAPVATTTKSLNPRQFKAQLQRIPSEAFAQASLGLSPLQKSMTIAHVSATNAASTQSGPLGQQDLYKNCGTLAHAYMEMLAQRAGLASSLGAWNKPMRRWLMRLGHNESAAKKGADWVMAALQTTLASQAGQWVLQDHDQAASELSLMQASESGAKNHVIDRTFIEQGTRWIIDYKLGLVDEAETSAAAAEAHRPQLARYASLFADAGLPIKTAVLFLSTGRMVEL